MKKFLTLCFTIVLSLCMLCGCEITTTDNTVSSLNNQVINIYTSKTESTTTSTVESAVEKVYDSVVVINSFMSNGYGSGSGVIIGESETNTYIVTCHHVIEDANSYEVILSDQTTYQATLVGGDPKTDIAVLQISKVDLPIVEFVENSTNIKLGSTAIAIGNPLGILANTVTVGSVSYVNREITSSDGTQETLIQTDAAINSGNSGGGLFDINGNLIGIVSSKYASSGVEGLGFAVPANTVKEIVSQLLKNGYVEGRYDLGLTISEGYTRSNYMGQMTLVTYISEIDELGCAYNILQVNDIISSITIKYKDTSKEDETYTISTSTNAYEVINKELELGDKLVFSVTRANKAREIEVELTQYVYR